MAEKISVVGKLVENDIVQKKYSLRAGHFWDSYGRVILIFLILNGKREEPQLWQRRALVSIKRFWYETNSLSARQAKYILDLICLPVGMCFYTVRLTAAPASISDHCGLETALILWKQTMKPSTEKIG